MTRTRLLGAAILFLTATAALAPIANFFTHSGNNVPSETNFAPRPEGPSPFVDATETVWSCTPFGDASGLRGNHRERVCGPKTALHAAAPAAKREYLPRQAYLPRKAGPLNEAVIASIAGAGEAAPPSLLDTPSPTTPIDPLALAVETGRGGPGSWGAPQLPTTPGLPQNLLAGFVPAINETQPDPETTPVVPLPGALPLIITGFGGLLAAARRRRRSTVAD